MESKIQENSNDYSGNTDELTYAQMEQIRNDISSQQPMIGNETKIDSLLPLYESSNSPGFIPGITYLSSQFSFMRKVRGDGNCFYRALLFGYLENLLKYKNLLEFESLAQLELERIIKVIEGSMSELVALGYSEFAIETFYDELLEILRDLFSLTNESLCEMFQEGGKADYLTWYMRVLTSGYLKRDPIRFLPFVEGLYIDIDSFCTHEVEPMNKECEHIQIIALTEYLGLKVEISYLDGKAFNASSGINIVNFPDPSNTLEYNSLSVPFVIYLLYRPGHYDLLYK